MHKFSYSKFTVWQCHRNCSTFAALPPSSEQARHRHVHRSACRRGSRIHNSKCIIALNPYLNIVLLNLMNISPCLELPVVLTINNWKIAVDLQIHCYMFTFTSIEVHPGESDELPFCTDYVWNPSKKIDLWEELESLWHYYRDSKDLSDITSR